MTFTLSWTDKASNETGYRIYRDGQVITELPANSTSFVDSVALLAGESAEYYLEVYSPSGRPETTVHLFLSPALAMQLPTDSFVNSLAGNYTIQYNSFDGQVTRMIVAPGNNP